MRETFTLESLRSTSPERTWELIASYANREGDWPNRLHSLMGLADKPKHRFRDLERTHAIFAKTLRWLCTIGGSGRPPLRGTVPRDVFQFLNKNAAEMYDLSLKSPGGVYLTFRTQYISCVGLLCRWIIEQAGEKMPREIPLRICQYEKCGRFFVSERKGAARFCIDRNCRQLAANANRTPEEKRNYMRDYRVLLAVETLSKLDNQKQIEAIRKIRKGKFRSALENIIRAAERKGLSLQSWVASRPDFAIRKVRA